MGFLKNALNLRSKAEEEASDISSLMAKAEEAVESIIHGYQPQRRSGGVEEFWQFREYITGDRPQDIDWRQSGKTQKVFIRQKEWHNTQDNLFWCSQNSSMRFHSSNLPTKLDAARILTMSLAILLTRSEQRVSLLGQTEMGKSETTLENMANNLCLPTDGPSTPTKPKHITKNTHAFFVGDFLNNLDEIKNSLQPFLSQVPNAILIQILDPAELSLPYDGRVVFEDMQSETRQIIQHVPSVKEQYIKRIERHNTLLKNLCKNHGWSYIQHSTDKKVSETLQRIFSQVFA